MLRRFLAFGAFLAVTAALPLLPEGDAQQKVCPRGVQINQMQVRSQQQFNSQQQTRQAQDRQQRTFMEKSRQVQQPRPQTPVASRQVPPAQTRTATRSSTTLTPVTREVVTPTRNVVTTARSVTQTPVRAIPPNPGNGIGTRVTGVQPRPTAITSAGRTVTEGLTRSRQVELVPVTQRTVRTETTVAGAGPRQVTQRPTAVTQEARQLHTTSRALHQEAVKLSRKSRSVHETRNITTLTWNMSCMQCHQTAPRTAEPIAQTRPQPPTAIRQPSPQPPQRFPVLGPRPTTTLTAIGRPQPVLPEPWRVGPMPTPGMIARLTPRPPMAVPTGPAVRFPLVDPRPQQSIQVAILRNRPTPEPWAERPAQRPLLDPLAPAAARPAPAVEPRVLEAITREMLERPTAPRLPHLIADPLLVGRWREPLDSIPVRDEDAAEVRLAAPVYSERDLQAPSLPALPESVLALRRSEEELFSSGGVELTPSMADLIETQDQIPAELQAPSREFASGAATRPASARLTPLEALAPALPALPESVLGPG